ncbi:MAG: DUF488 domain-containing protein [Candidatus Aenigmatarchaeota archaeon]
MSKKEYPLLYSLGTSVRSEGEFIELLRTYSIRTVVDVRSFPTSRLEHFKRENLEILLARSGIRYVYLGKELGGFRKGGYESYTSTEHFLSGIEKLEHIAQEGSTVFICAERFPWRCHRRFIGNVLKERGWRVVHIIDKDRVWEPL